MRAHVAVHVHHGTRGCTARASDLIAKNELGSMIMAPAAPATCFKSACTASQAGLRSAYSDTKDEPDRFPFAGEFVHEPLKTLKALPSRRIAYVGPTPKPLACASSRSGRRCGSVSVPMLFRRRLGLSRAGREAPQSIFCESLSFERLEQVCSHSD